MAELARRANEQERPSQPEQQQLQSMSTAALVKQALSELRLLVKAEVLYARLEFEEEWREAKHAVILLGCCVALLSGGLSVALLGVALAFPLARWLAAFIVAAVLLTIAAVCGALGYRRLPRRPLQRTQQRLKDDLAITKDQFA